MQGRLLLTLCVLSLAAAVAAPAPASAAIAAPTAHAAKKSKKKKKKSCAKAGSAAKSKKKNKQCSKGEGLLPPEHALFIDPPAYDFGVVGSIQGSTTKVFRVINIGTQPSGPIVDDVLAGSDLTRSAYFSRAEDTCMSPAPVALAPGATCTITVRFSNFAPELEFVNSSIVASDFQNGVDVPATISGLAAGPGPNPASLTVAPKTKDFGPFAVGTDPPRKLNFTVRNQGGSTSGVLAVSVFNGNQANPAFSVLPADDHCTSTVLLGGEQCSLDVTFNPSVSGTNWAASLVINGAPGGSAQASLSGSS